MGLKVAIYSKSEKNGSDSAKSTGLTLMPSKVPELRAQ